MLHNILIGKRGMILRNLPQDGSVEYSYNDIMESNRFIECAGGIGII